MFIPLLDHHSFETVTEALVLLLDCSTSQYKSHLEEKKITLQVFFYTHAHL